MCSERQAFPVGMSHPLQMLHGNHSQFYQFLKFELGMKVIKLVKGMIGWEVTVTGRAAECKLTLGRVIFHIF